MTIIAAKRDQYLWVATGDPRQPYRIVPVIAWEIGEIGEQDQPIPIAATGRIDPAVTRCCLATRVGWHVLRENVVFRSSPAVIAYLRQDAIT